MALAGEKIIPTQQEDCISGSPLVAGVVMFGSQQDQPGVLIEPSPSYVINPDDQGALAKFRNDLWYVSRYYTGGIESDRYPGMS